MCGVSTLITDSNDMKKTATLLILIYWCTISALSQFTKQNNPLGYGEDAILGKIQFVSSNEGWIACGNNGSLLHTTDAGSNWTVVTPFPEDKTGNMSDPATSMSWVSPLFGRALKTYGYSNDSEDYNGATVYKTANGGGLWSKTDLPKSFTTTVYSSSDLTGDWQLHLLSTRNHSEMSSKNKWIYGNGTINASGAFSITFHHSDGSTTTNNVVISVNERGEITVEDTKMGFMSTDKQMMVLSGYFEEGSPTLFILQRQNNGVTYTSTDLEGSWYMHTLSSGTAESGSYAGYAYGELSGNSSGTLTGTLTGVENTLIPITMPLSINAQGIVGDGMQNHGFLSPDKKNLVMVATSETGAANLVIIQKKTDIVYSVSDLLGLWQGYSLVADNTNDLNQWTNWGRQQLKFDPTGTMSISKMVVNNENREDIQTSVSLTAGGILTINGMSETNGFLSPDKSLMVITNPDGSGGFSLAVVMRDLSISGDCGMQIQFADESTGWASTYNSIYSNFRIFKTTDGGTNWIQINGENNPVGGFYHFVDAQNGWMIGQKGATQSMLFSILNTTDGGMSWDVQKPDVGYSEDIFFTDLQNGWVVGRNSLIMRTKNGGQNWEAITPAVSFPPGTTVNHKSVFFVDSQNGFISADSDHPTMGNEQNYLLKTADGGDSWTAMISSISHSIFDIHFTDKDNGWLSGDYGEIVRYQTATGLKNPLTKEIAINPNPVDKGFYIDGELAIEHITITDLRGANILKAINRNNYMDVSTLPSGIYMVELKNSSDKYCGKLIKK